jgi:small subunit ribosomal protein S1
MKSYRVNNPNSLMEDLLKNSPLQIKQFKPGDLVDGVVVNMSNDQILVDIGSKSEGVVLKDEFTENHELEKTLKVGDNVSCVVIQSEDKQGYALLSLKRAEKEKTWKDLDNAFKNNSVVEATVLEYNKGGLLTEINGTRGFIPLSHLKRSHFTEEISDFSGGSENELKSALKVLSGKKLMVKVIELDKAKNRLVLSEKDATQEYSEEERSKKLQSVKAGDVLNGIVTGIMQFGIFVDLDGLEGLVHISEIAWEKVSNPGDYYSVGSPIKVLVLGIDDTSKKLALSVKRLSNNPWEGVEERYKAGQKVNGKVSKVVPFGAFISLESGLEGLVHVSEMKDKLNIGDEVEAVVTNVDGAGQKLALSTKQLTNEEK